MIEIKASFPGDRKWLFLLVYHICLCTVSINDDTKAIVDSSSPVDRKTSQVYANSLDLLTEMKAFEKPFIMEVPNNKLVSSFLNVINFHNFPCSLQESATIPL